MRIPIPEKIDEMCDAFEEYHNTHKKVRIDMCLTTVDHRAIEEKNYCGTPACHGGLFCLLFSSDWIDSSSNEYRYWETGKKMMQQFLFDDDHVEHHLLQEWAQHSNHWPNRYGDYMFRDPIAFGGRGENNVVTIPQIVKTWRQAAVNIRKDQK